MFFADIVFIACPPSTMAIPPVGIGSIAQNLRREGYRAPIIDLNIRMFQEATEKERTAWELDKKNLWLQEDTLDELWERFYPQIDAAINEAMEYGQHLIGFTVIHSRELFVSRMVDWIKELDPERLVVVGGPTVSQPTMRRAFTYRCKYDFVVVGEGEQAMVDMLECFRFGRAEEVMKIPGVLHRLPAYTQDVEPAPLIDPLDQLKWPRYIGLDPSDYRVGDPFPVVWSRGCPGRCSFCEASKIWGKLRTRDPDNIHEELVYLVNNFGVTHFAPFDPIVNGNVPKLVSLCERLINQGPVITWEGNFMASTKMSADVYRTLHRSGCRRVYFGLESASPKVMRLMRKPFSLETARNNIIWADEAGCDVYVNIITGFPGEGETEFQETLQFLRDNHEHIAGIEFITECQIPEDTDLYENPDSYGINFGDTFDGFRWESLDGTNNYKVRQERSRIVEQEARRLGIRTSASTTLTDGQHLESNL